MVDFMKKVLQINIIQISCQNEYFKLVIKKTNFKIEVRFSTPDRNRTGTSFRSSVFETDASTYSATRASGLQR